MNTAVRCSVFALALVAVAAPLSAQSAAAPAVTSAPDVGQMAPDFTAQWADTSGTKAKPVTLSALRGQVVVLAFYPGDRTTGCTAEMTKFRDEYQTIFGKDVVVLPISVDNLDSHSSWAKELKFPFSLVSDPDQKVAKAYGSAIPGRATDSRTVFVIGKDGKISYRALSFGALSETAYTALAKAVSEAKVGGQ